MLFDVKKQKRSNAEYRFSRYDKTGCQLGLRRSERPATCDLVSCELTCELYLKEKNIKLKNGRQQKKEIDNRGLKFKLNNGTGFKGDLEKTRNLVLAYIEQNKHNKLVYMNVWQLSTKLSSTHNKLRRCIKRLINEGVIKRVNRCLYESLC